jgi:hypothetical protein
MMDSITVVCDNPKHAPPKPNAVFAKLKRRPTVVAEFSGDGQGGWAVLGRHHDSRRPTPPGRPNVRVVSILPRGVVTTLSRLRCNLCGEGLPRSMDTAILDSLVRQGVSEISISQLKLLSSTQR